MTRRRVRLWPLLIALPAAGLALMVGASLALLVFGSMDADGEVEGGWLWIVVAVYCLGGLALLAAIGLGLFMAVRAVVDRASRR